MGTFPLYYSCWDWLWRNAYGVIDCVDLISVYQRLLSQSLNLIVDQATATGMSYLFRSTGSVVGITTSQCVLQNLLKRWLTARIHGSNAEEVSFSIRSC